MADFSPCHRRRNSTRRELCNLILRDDDVTCTMAPAGGAWSAFLKA
jgi:hypothetical protein